jgi:NAD+ diphosphatase
MNFDSRYIYKESIPLEEEACWFIFRQEKVLTMTDGSATKPLLIRAQDISGPDFGNAVHVGQLNRIDCYAVSDSSEKGIEFPGAEWISLRQSYGKFDEEMFWIYGRARHLLLWAENSRFCGRCGNLTVLKPDERCFLCSSCGLAVYPRLSPAVIVSVEKEGKILLARAARFRPAQMCSVLAGFVEPGESLEECARREIREETGIEIKNIRYFKSQPWPFPDSLMVAYTAEYAGGDLRIDEKEIVDAGWYGPDDLPMIPGKLSVARALIDYFVERHHNREAVRP